MVESIKPLLAQSKAVFDVGANSGFFSKAICESGFCGKLVLFEPVPNLLSIAVQTLAPYNIEKIFINAALGEECGTIDLFLPHDSNIGWITAVKEKARTGKRLNAKMESTRKHAEIYRPDLIKIDVEGFEIFVLRPILDLIGEDYKPDFLVELGWGISNPHWEEFILLAKALQKKGYCFYEANSGKKNIDISSLETLSGTIDVIITTNLL